MGEEQAALQSAARAEPEFLREAEEVEMGRRRGEGGKLENKAFYKVHSGKRSVL